MDAHYVESVAPLALLAITVSGLCALALHGGGRWLTSLHPAGQVRLLSAAIVAPGACVVLAWTIAGYDYWVMVRPGEVASASPTGVQLPVSINVLLVALIANRAWRLGRILCRAQREAMRLLNASSIGPSDVRTLPVDDPHAFVLGWMSPVVFVSRGLSSSLDANELAIVVAHERSHARHRHPLARLLAAIALLWHLPFAARWLGDQLHLAQELLADRDSVALCRDAGRVAATLVRFARLRPAPAAASVGFWENDIRIRVMRLVDPGDEGSGISATALAMATGALFLVACGFAAPLHASIHLLAALLNRLP
jgi:hypothetical protein